MYVKVSDELHGEVISVEKAKGECKRFRDGRGRSGWHAGSR
jgi:hypothetical protein